MKIFYSFLIIFLVASIGFSTNLAFGHGLGGETHPPVSLDGRDVTLSIDISPSVFDKDDPQRYITLNLSESKNQSIVEHVTFALEMTKDGEQIFRRIFHDDSGNLIIKVISDDSDEIKIKGDKSPAIEAWMKTATEPVTMTGNIFNSGGLYEYKVEILTADSDFNFLDKRLELIGAVSLAEHNTYEILDSQGNSNEVNVISYFDTIENFEFDSDKIFFSMPFDWNQDFEQLSVVHEEVRISKEFSEFLHTKYEAKLNGIQLKDTNVTIDDYSVDGRTVHIVLNQKELNEIREQAMQESISQMFFELGPSNDAGLPLEAITPDMRYRVFLSWEPEIIKAGEDVTLFLQTNELFTDKSNKNIEYKVEMSFDGNQIYKEHISGTVNSETPDKIPFNFSPENVGTVKLDMLDIEGNTLSDVSFLVVVNPQEVAKFPIKLESISESNPDDGKYRVDLTWFPNTLELGESEFIMSFYDKDSRMTTGDVSYDFVLVQNGTEIHRKSGIASGGGTFENFVFVEKEVGDVTIRIEKIAGTDEYVEITVNVVPEFGLLALLVLGTAFGIVIIASKTGKKTPLYRNYLESI
ncbi:MAG: PEFG-CTERM sorting domain-containing protein [Nitrosopumilus sp.]|nr:PEFG-CTERM sorting domain-containing protein [Nitrosopumilus sp.]MBT8242672.1 PEFG-CTERM sorting domain-containing protein [Nitrosopumilus sp.]NNL37263.1 PEFG-CTERM sorting domain-containing protein [Nitrosopumilus sp.]NNM02358.1 PEFG-CTERM sorting domain-containing protein [Nitrosopumilus sp.]